MKKPQAPLKDWLFLIATNEMRAYQRKKTIKILFFLDPGKEEVDLPFDDQRVLGVENMVLRQQLLSTFLLKLPIVQRQCLILYTLKGYSQNEIALILDTSARAVESMVHRALKRLKELADREQEAEKRADNTDNP